MINLSYRDWADGTLSITITSTTEPGGDAVVTLEAVRTGSCTTHAAGGPGVSGHCDLMWEVHRRVAPSALSIDPMLQVSTIRTRLRGEPLRITCRGEGEVATKSDAASGMVLRRLRNCNPNGRAAGERFRGDQPGSLAYQRWNVPT